MSWGAYNRTAPTYLDRFDRHQQHVSLWLWGVAFGA